MLQSLGDNAKGEGLDLRDRLIAAGPVAQGPGKGVDFGEPAAVLFTFGRR